MTGKYRRTSLAIMKRRAKQSLKEFSVDITDNELAAYITGLDYYDFQMLYKIIKIYSKKRGS